MEIIYTPDTLDYMYRYLERYVGKYKVIAEYNQATNTFPKDKSFEDLYIPCKEGCVIKHTYEGNDILALFFYEDKPKARKIATKLRNAKVEIQHDLKHSNLDAMILFHSDNIGKVANIVGAITKGKNVSPTSIKNLPTKEKVKKEKYVIPKEDIEKLEKVTPELSRTDKMQFFRKHNKTYLEKIDKNNGKEYSKITMKNTGLTARELIHKEGHWEKYVKYIKSIR